MPVYSKITIERILDLKDERVDGAIHVLVEAFRDDAVRNTVIGDDEDLRLLIHSAAARATILGGHLYVAIDEKHQVVGTTSWFPPGPGFLETEEQMDQGMKQFSARVAATKPEVFGWYATLIAKYRELAKKAFGTPDDPDGSKFKSANWRLNSFAVLPSHQGKGIGKLLLRVGEQQAAEMNKAVCLETNNAAHVPMYEHLGYKVVAQDTVEGPPGKASFNQYAFLKTQLNGTLDHEVE